MLIHHIDRFLRRTKISPTKFGREAVGDPNFVLDLRDGREPRSATVRRVMAYIDAREEAARPPEPVR